TEDVQHDRKRKKRKRKEEETEYDIYASKPEQAVSEEDETLNGLLRMLRRAKQKGRESKAARLQQLLKEHEEYLRRKNYLSEGQKGDDDVDVVLSSGGKGDRRKGCRKN
uniref:SAP domain-containing protein n=1 Tax=Ascaris lumbricoides TaxID=6252 RepID=A0A0M3HW51_ASCLU